MKSFILIPILLQIATMSIAQGNWRVSTPTFESVSHPNLRIHQIQRTDSFTVFEMSYATTTEDSTYLEICNTFHLVSGNVRVGTFVKAEGAPVVNMRGASFECEPKAQGRFVPPATIAYFKIYFDALPQNISIIDLIEFNGREACEFVMRGIRLPFSGGDNPILADEPTVPNIVIPDGERRKVVLGNETTVHQPFVDIELWDDDQLDGDIISLSLNDEWVLRGYELLKSRKLLRLNLRMGVNWLMMRAENLGRIPPNTAAIVIIEQGRRKLFSLHSDMGQSEVLKLVRE